MFEPLFSVLRVALSLLEGGPFTKATRCGNKSSFDAPRLSDPFFLKRTSVLFFFYRSPASVGVVFVFVFFSGVTGSGCFPALPLCFTQHFFQEKGPFLCNPSSLSAG